MRISKLAWVLLSVFTIATIASGCRGPLTFAPRADTSSSSWLAHATKGQDLIYVSLGVVVSVYTYPNGTPIGELTAHQPYGLCVDKFGDVFIPEYTADDVLEFAHGGTRPIATINLPNSNPYACSVDSTTGKLAVTNYDGGASIGGGVMIVGGPPPWRSIYTDPKIFFYYFCGYDDAGNLYVDGEDTRFGFVLAELPKGSQLFTNLTIRNLPKPILLPGNVQWDGADLALGDVDRNVVYRLHINGSNATVVGSMPLTRGQQVNQFFITALRDDAAAPHGSLRLIGPASVGSVVRYWNYPVGGRATKAISAPNFPFGAVVSPAVK